MQKQTKIISALLLALGVLMWSAPSTSVRAESEVNETAGTAFTYQGRLMESGLPANGAYDMVFRLFDSASATTQLGSDIVLNDVTVADGLFTVLLDFGPDTNLGFFNGRRRFLQIEVAGVKLNPLQELTPTPYALALPGLWTQQNDVSPNLIGGFYGNQIVAGVVGGVIGGGGDVGAPNEVSGSYATVSGGSNNDAGAYATVSGGRDNHAGGELSTVAGGRDNQASGEYATVSGGRSNQANGDYSFAAGTGAIANHINAFVWSDGNGSADFASTGARQFAVHAAGGIRLTGGAVSFNDAFALPIVDGVNGQSLVTDGNGAVSWGIPAAPSDRKLKENFATADPEAVLAAVVELPISTWNYIEQDDAVRHIGPVAQDFYAAFGVGAGDATISIVDSGGVALAAIQGLDRRNVELAAQNAELSAQNAVLAARLAAIEQALGLTQAGASTHSDLCRQ